MKNCLFFLLLLGLPSCKNHSGIGVQSSNGYIKIKESVRQKAKELIVNFDNKIDKHEYSRKVAKIKNKENLTVAGFIKQNYLKYFPMPLQEMVFSYYYGLTNEELVDFFNNIEKRYKCKISGHSFSYIDEGRVIINDSLYSVYPKLFIFLCHKEDFDKVSLITSTITNVTKDSINFDDIIASSIYSARFLLKLKEPSKFRLFTIEFIETVFERLGLNNLNISEKQDLSIIFALLIENADQLFISNKDLDLLISKFDTGVFTYEIDISKSVLNQIDAITSLLERGTYAKRKLSNNVDYLFYKLHVYMFTDELGLLLLKVFFLGITLFFSVMIIDTYKLFGNTILEKHGSSCLKTKNGSKNMILMPGISLLFRFFMSFLFSKQNVDHYCYFLFIVLSFIYFIYYIFPLF